jgi:lysophospholipase L1-like esterase
LNALGWVVLTLALAAAAVLTQKITSPWARRLATLATSLALTGVCAEGLTRWVFPAPTAYDWQRISVPLAWKQWWFEVEDRPVGAPRDLFSLDDRQIPRTDAPRVLFVGDSFTAGQGVRSGESFVQRLAAQLDGVEVLNHAMPGLDSATEAALYLDYSATWRPDTVVWAFVLNDLPAAPGTSEGCARTGRAGMHDFIVDRSQQAVQNGSSRVVDMVRTAWRYRQLTQCMSTSYQQRYDPEVNPEGLAKLGAQLQAVASEVQGRGGRFVFVVLPLMHQLSDYPFTAAHEAIAEVARAAGAEVLDVGPAFRGMDERALWASLDDHHPNVTAHALIAAELSEGLDLPRLRETRTCSEGCDLPGPSAQDWLDASRDQVASYIPRDRDTRPRRVVAKIMALQAVALEPSLEADAVQLVAELTAMDRRRH